MSFKFACVYLRALQIVLSSAAAAVAADTKHEYYYDFIAVSTTPKSRVKDWILFLCIRFHLFREGGKFF